MILHLHHRYRTLGGEERAIAGLRRLTEQRLGESTALLERDSTATGAARAARGLLLGGIDPAEVAAAVRPRWSIAPSVYRSAFPPWLPDEVAARAAAAFARDQRAPLRWDRATRRLLRSRATAVVLHDLALVAREHDVTYSHPLADPRVVHALAVDGGAWGFAGRTDLFRRLVGDLLPDDVLSRTSKVRFNATRWGPAEREFARRWDGAGVDGRLVDPERLREAWLAPAPPFAAELLLHAAWLADRRLPFAPGAGESVRRAG